MVKQEFEPPSERACANYLSMRNFFSSMTKPRLKYETKQAFRAPSFAGGNRECAAYRGWGQLFECQKGNRQPVITQGSYTAVSQENWTQVTQVEFDPENRGDPGRPRVFTRHGLWVCVAHFKSKEPESKRPRICLEEGRAATRGQTQRLGSETPLCCFGPAVGSLHRPPARPGR